MKIEKVERLIAYLHNKNEYVIHIRNFKTRASVKKGTQSDQIQSKTLVKIIY